MKKITFSTAHKAVTFKTFLDMKGVRYAKNSELLTVSFYATDQELFDLSFKFGRWI